MKRDVKESLRRVSESRRAREGRAHERKKDWVSICVPNYNKGDYLEETLVSITKQTYKHVELVIVDDFSSDRSRLVIEDFRKKYGRLLKIVSIDLPDRTGTAWAQNIAYYLSKGEFVANWDSDDVCDPLRIEKQVQFLKENTLDLCGTNFSIFRSNPNKPTVGDGGYWLKYDTESIVEDYVFNGIHRICFGSLMFRHTVLEKLGGMTKELIGTEDYDFIERAIAQGFKPGNLREPLYQYRSSPDQRSKVFHSS